MENDLVDALTTYLTTLLPPTSEQFKTLEKYAAENKIPIMDPVGINFLMQLIRIQKPQHILEIGTAIGYSALKMLEAYPKAQITTIERDERCYEQATKNIQAFDKAAHIRMIYGDALTVLEQFNDKTNRFDFIFIDAAKAQYKHFFEKAHHFLNEGGMVVSDNVLFKGLVANPTHVTQKRIEKLVQKIRAYNEWLINHPGYATTIVPIGDGVAVSVKNKKC